jgi:hypothetical protein
MAKQTGQGANSSESVSFNQGLLKDYDDVFYPEGTWSHARNATNFTVGGDLGLLGNEPANGLCTMAPYTIIGGINVTGDNWVIFSTDNTNSEIGYFSELNCEYTKIVNDSCLGFKTSNLITGISKQNFDCTWQIYWSDGKLNPDRTMNIGDISMAPFSDPWPGVPYVCKDLVCVGCEPKLPLELDCDALRLARYMTIPCTTVQRGSSGGSLLNGSYRVAVAYTINQQRITDYFISNTQSIFEHDDESGALKITINNLDDKRFDEIEVVVLSLSRLQPQALKLGYYSTNGPIEIFVDQLPVTLETVPFGDVARLTPTYERSDAIYRNGPYALRVGPRSKFDFNYQPLANQIDTEWVMVEQAPDYYRKGGSDTGYLRDEQYAFFIRWVYITGDRSSSYHIPGRAKEIGKEISAPGVDIPASLTSRDNVEFAQATRNGTLSEYNAGGQPKLWEMINTAYSTSPSSLLPADNAELVPGKVVAYGKMGYWESSEKYPDDKPEIWNASSYAWSTSNNPDHDLCGKPVRHHKMPADIINTTKTNNGDTRNFSRVRMAGPRSPRAIRILGVQFKNIKPPRDNQGNLIPGVVGYEILRSSRQGNKTIIAKGIINNMRYYTEPNDNERIYYQNYPYNNLREDPSLTSQKWNVPDGKNAWNSSSNFLTGYSANLFTFHSPDTGFKKPFIGTEELRIYGEVGDTGNTRGNFDEVDEHPKQKLVTDMGFLISIFAGIAYATMKVRGKETKIVNTSQMFNSGNIGFGPSISNPLTSAVGPTFTASSVLGTAMLNTMGTAVTGVDGALTAAQTVMGLAEAPLMAVGTGGIGSNTVHEYEMGEANSMPPTLKAFGGIINFANYVFEGADTALELIRTFSKGRQFALKYYSHAALHKHSLGNARHLSENTRRYIRNASYLNNQLQSFDNYSINNIYRSGAVALELIGASDAGNIGNPSLQDNSTQIVSTAREAGLLTRNGSASYVGERTFDTFSTTASCYYAGLKQRIRNQYGQLESIVQVPTGCVIVVNNNNPITTVDTQPLGSVSQIGNAPRKTMGYNSPVIFGGDIYIGRYTEKNTFFYFYDWLFKQPDGTEFDYRLRTMINNPRFWADFTKFDTNGALQDTLSAISNANWGNLKNALLAGLPSRQHNLDCDTTIGGNDTGDNSSILANIASFFRLTEKYVYMYLFQSGVRDFFVESEINVEYRDWGNDEREWHYDPYFRKNLAQLFATEYIKSGNYYKYDYSLSVSRVYNTPWGALQPRYYKPDVAETCYTSYPKRVIYSLPQIDTASTSDNWRIYLVNNYKEFSSRVTAIKPIGKNGAMILFESDSPVQFLGSESLELDAGTKITVGDGSLFSQAMQNLSNADSQFKHGSCQNRLSIINTPVGIYYISQAQGKIFGVDGNGLQEVSSAGMRWWFSRYLPSTLLKDFPDFQLYDNPIAGVGCQAVFDNTNQIIYFSKRDFIVKEEYKDLMYYAPGVGLDMFKLTGSNFGIKLGDPQYFYDTSWTVSYDPKVKFFISFHDWHPELTLASQNYFLTTQTQNGKGGIWRHNDRTDLFSNFYGTDYPFEVEYIAQTGQQVNTLKSIEYNLECYTYAANGIDMYHVLDFNFDQAIVHNTEQVSGTLNLILQPKNDFVSTLTYPKYNNNSIDVLYTKTEQKYRFNQFWDVTKDRGEYTYPTVQNTIWDTELNGYKRSLNPNNLDYTKAPFQRKKFRHYTTHVVLRRMISGAVKMLFKIANNKNQYSPR